MKKTFELLQHRGLRSVENIEDIIMARYDFRDILKLNQELFETIRTTKPADHDLRTFNFIGDSDITAQHETCAEWGCRLSRVAEAAKFATLYCDTLYISNYFADYPPPESITGLNPEEEFTLKYDYAGDLMILVMLKPLLEEGIVKLIQPEFHICPICTDKLSLQSFSNQTDQVIDNLTDEYIKLCRVTLSKDEHVSGLSDTRYEFEIQGPKDLYESGGDLMPNQKIPGWLLRKSGFHKAGTRKVSYQLTPDDMRKVEIPKDRIGLIARDITHQHISSLIMDTKYLTCREIDTRFLSLLTTDPHFREYNDVLKSELLCRIPMFKNLPLETALALRKKEHESFLVFRNTIGKFIDEHLKGKKPLSKADARGFYEDLIYPELCKLDNKVKNLKKGAILKNIRDVTITSGLLSLGLFSGMVPTNIQGLLTAVGGFHLARELISSIASILDTQNEIRNHNLYFLWRLSHKATRHPHR